MEHLNWNISVFNTSRVVKRRGQTHLTMQCHCSYTSVHHAVLHTFVRVKVLTSPFWTQAAPLPTYMGLLKRVWSLVENCCDQSQTGGKYTAWSSPAGMALFLAKSWSGKTTLFILCMSVHSIRHTYTQNNQHMTVNKLCFCQMLLVTTNSYSIFVHYVALIHVNHLKPTERNYSLHEMITQKHVALFHTITWNYNMSDHFFVLM